MWRLKSSNPQWACIIRLGPDHRPRKVPLQDGYRVLQMWNKNCSYVSIKNIFERVCMRKNDVIGSGPCCRSLLSLRALVQHTAVTIKSKNLFPKFLIENQSCLLSNQFSQIFYREYGPFLVVLRTFATCVIHRYCNNNKYLPPHTCSRWNKYIVEIAHSIFISESVLTYNNIL